MSVVNFLPHPLVEHKCTARDCCVPTNRTNRQSCPRIARIDRVAHESHESSRIETGRRHFRLSLELVCIRVISGHLRASSRAASGPSGICRSVWLLRGHILRSSRPFSGRTWGPTGYATASARGAVRSSQPEPAGAWVNRHRSLATRRNARPAPSLVAGGRVPPRRWSGTGRRRGCIRGS